MALTKQESHVTYTNHDNFTATAGQSVKIETSPDGLEILDATVPAGKTWKVSLSLIHI